MWHKSNRFSKFDQTSTTLFNLIKDFMCLFYIDQSLCLMLQQDVCKNINAVIVKFNYFQNHWLDTASEITHVKIINPITYVLCFVQLTYNYALIPLIILVF